MKLAYLYPEHLSLSTARLLQTMATLRALLRQGAQVHLLIGWFAGLNNQLNNLGLKPNSRLFVERLPMWQKGPGLPLPFSWHAPYQWATWIRLTQLVKQGVEWILLRHLKLADYLLSHRPSIKLRVLFEVHELFSETAQEEKLAIANIKNLRRMEARVFSHADQLVAISEPLARILEAMPEVEKPVIVTPSGVEDSFFRITNLARLSNLVVYAGGLTPWKGVDLLLQALALLPQAKLEILGDIPGTANWQRLKILAKNLKIESRVTMRHWANQEQVCELLARASVAVWPGTGRQRIAAEFTSPLKLFEYLAAGCAIVAPNLPSARAIVKNGIHAVLFAPDDYQSLANAIDFLLNNPKQAAKLGQAGRKLAYSYTWDKRAQSLLSLMAATTAL